MYFLALLGFLSVGYGCYTFWLRAHHPERFGKLEAMKSRWGERRGVGLHVVGYSVIPIVLGLLLLGGGLDEAVAAAEEEPTELANAELNPRFQVGSARAELLAAGFSVASGENQDRIQVFDADFTASITKSGAAWQVECPGKPATNHLSLDKAVSQVMQAHTPASGFGARP